MDILIFINITTQPPDIPVTFELYTYIYIFFPPTLISKKSMEEHFFAKRRYYDKEAGPCLTAG